MNKEETLKILTVISGAFPGSMKPDDLTVGIWQSMLPEPYEMVSKALQQHIRTSKYPPKIADLVELMHKESVPSMSAEEAWEEVRSAYMSLWSETDYGEAYRAWSGLSDLVRKICTPNDLIDWAFRLTSANVHQFEKPRFMKAYENVQIQEKQKAIASKPITAIAGNTVKKIGSGDNG